MPSGPEWFIVLAVVLVIFGGSQLPKLARNLGKAQKEFKDGLSEAQQEDEATKPNAAETSAAARAETKVDNVDKVEQVEKPES
jgi:sec-independent protein translocase protein TatA